MLGGNSTKRGSGTEVFYDRACINLLCTIDQIDTIDN